MREEKPFLISLGIVLVFFVVALLSKHIHIAALKVENIYESTFAIEDLRNIKFETHNSDLIIENTDEKDIKVTIYGINDKEIYAYNNGDELQVRYMNQNTFDDKEEYMKVSIPESYKYDLGVLTAGGNIEIADYSKANLNVESTSGNIDLGIANKLTLKNQTGNTSIDKVTNTLSLKSISGDVNIEYLSLKNDSKIETNSSNVDINKINKVYVKTKTTDGEVSVKKNGKKTYTTLNITTNTGNITVN